jgi:competence protein ComFC
MLRLLRDVADLVYPPACVCCDGEVGDSHFCKECDARLAALANIPACPLCAFPMGVGAACPNCLGEGAHPFARIVALGPFCDPLKKLIHRMKYSRRWSLAEILADRLAQEERVKTLLRETDVLIPIPLHWKKQISRGYNQSDLIANRLSKFGPKSFRVLARIPNTSTQTAVHSRAKRIENLRNAFDLASRHKVENKRVVIVDDVTTSMATLRSAARIIQTGNPISISALVLATGDAKRSDFQAV